MPAGSRHRRKLHIVHSGEVEKCRICGSVMTEETADSPLAEAGRWLSDAYWQDCAAICPRCRESRAELAMMYLIDR